jgi:R.HinP1I restriction endonuclease
MEKKYRHTSQFGSDIAKGGFRNEQDVVDKFNNWKVDEQVKLCLIEMGYELKDITNVEAFMIREIIKNSEIKDRHNPKSDVQVQVTVYHKNIPDPQNISIKLVSSKSGFNQIDKRWVDKYSQMWKMETVVVDMLKQFTGELKPVDNGKGLRELSRMFLDELSDEKITMLLGFFESNKITIISDTLKGRGAFSAQWMLVVWTENEKESKWTFKSINEVLNHYSKGVVKISPRGSLNIGRLTMQRTGGDGGRDTSNMLQFKFNPLELFEV